MYICIHLSVCLSIYVSICIFPPRKRPPESAAQRLRQRWDSTYIIVDIFTIYLYIYIHILIYIYIYIYIYPSIYLSIYLYLDSRQENEARKARSQQQD